MANIRLFIKSINFYVFLSFCDGTHNYFLMTLLYSYDFYYKLLRFNNKKFNYI